MANNHVLSLKKCILPAIFFAALTALTACASQAPAQSAPDELDAAIREASDYLNASLTNGNKLMILYIQSDFPALSEYIIDELTANTVNDRVFTMVDRRQLDAIRAELDFQMSDEVDDESAQELGRMLGAETIISGAISPIGDLFRLRLRALDVQSARIDGQFNRNIPTGPTLAMLLRSPGTSIASGSGVASGARPAAPAGQANPAPAAPAAAQPALPTYRIGETGPAGGLIFYDKGNNSGGWRYLEAAPVEAEFQAVWSVRHTRVENTREEIGSGRRNTQLIVEAFRQVSGEWDTAAQQVNDLVFNGFNDWFIPSKTELDQMYGNLKRRNLGDFKNDWYWSSTTSTGSFSGGYADGQDFANGRISESMTLSTSSRYLVRPIRQVPGPDPARVSAAPAGTAGSADEAEAARIAASQRQARRARWNLVGNIFLGALLIGGLIALIIYWGPSPDAAPATS